MASDTLLPDWLTRCAENFPQRLAIKCGQVQWTFAELEQQVTHLARQLAAVGIQSGSRVALLASNGSPYVTCVHALTRLGAILVPLNTRLTLDELCWQLQDVRATFLLSDSQYACTPRAPRAILRACSLPTVCNGGTPLALPSTSAINQMIAGSPVCLSSISVASPS